MTPEQVKEVSDSGLVSIQSHTTTHPALAYMNTEQQAEQTPTAEEQRDQQLMLLNDCFAQNYENVTYEETAQTQIHIIIKDNQYQPSQEDIVKLERLLFDIDAMEALNEG